MKFKLVENEEIYKVLGAICSRIGGFTGSGFSHFPSLLRNIEYAGKKRTC
jgi:hypothetical protein